MTDTPLTEDTLTQYLSNALNHQVKARVEPSRDFDSLMIYVYTIPRRPRSESISISNHIPPEWQTMTIHEARTAFLDKLTAGLRECLKARDE